MQKGLRKVFFDGLKVAVVLGLTVYVILDLVKKFFPGSVAVDPEVEAIRAQVMQFSWPYFFGTIAAFAGRAFKAYFKHGHKTSFHWLKFAKASVYGLPSLAVFTFFVMPKFGPSLGSAHQDFVFALLTTYTTISVCDIVFHVERFVEQMNGDPTKDRKTSDPSG